jgi:predicted dehydrogenase
VTPIRLGIVGAGGIARAEHLPRFRQIAGVELAGVANRSEQSSRRVAEAEGIARIFPSWEALVADDDIDAVLVATWPNLHAPVTIDALGAGKHVLTEARMSATLEEAQAMRVAARAHPERVAMIVPASFSLWADRTIRRLVEEEAVGPIHHVRVLWDASGSVAPSEHWRWLRSASGVNAMALGILVEAMERWLGPTTSIQATGRIFKPEKPGPAGLVTTDVYDHVLVQATYSREVTASIEMSILTVRGGTRIELFGDEGSIDVDLAKAVLFNVSPNGDRSPLEIRPEDRLGWTAERDFIASIREGAPVELTDFETGVAYMAVVDAVDRSARGGGRVELAR